ncbi:LysM peptidoglycan-binding domain-containing protein [Sphingomonas sp.]|uniref:LysM peptidoglycan-binding domain-containing protein n=1 Tax=Sphingomonas sp. TaxID=28214 RepID=UPI003D6D32FC
MINYKEYFSDGVTINYSAATTYGTGLTTMLVVSQTEQQYQLSNGSYQTRVTTTDYQLDTTSSAWNGVTHGTFNGTFVGVQTHTRTVVDNNASTASETETHYVWWDAALESHIGTFRSPTDTLPPISDFVRDSSGHLVHLSRNAGGTATQVEFTTDAEGRVLARREHTPDNSQMSTEYHYLFDGAVRGATGNNGQPIAGDYIEALNQRGTTPGAPFRNGGPLSYANFDQNYEPMLPQGAGSGGSYVVREGDTLQSIAAQIWGDANLWYKLAEANGLGAGPPTAGMTLRIPDGIFSVHNSTSTFKIYDPNEAIGMTGPMAPQPKANAKNKCGIFGQILLTAISIAVTVVTAPFIGLAPAAMLGNAVSQGVGLATGIQQGGFSWKAVAMAGVTATVSFGIGEILGQGAMLGSQIVGDVVRGAAASAITQGIGVATHLQDKFSWAGVATAGVMAGVGGYVSRNVGGANGIWKGNSWVQTAAPSLTNVALSGAASAIAGAGLRSLVSGTDFGDNLIAALPDVIAQTVGRALGDRMSKENDGKQNQLFGSAQNRRIKIDAGALLRDDVSLAGGSNAYAANEDNAVVMGNMGILAPAARIPVGQTPKIKAVALIEDADSLDDLYKMRQGNSKLLLRTDISNPQVLIEARDTIDVAIDQWGQKRQAEALNDFQSKSDFGHETAPSAAETLAEFGPVADWAPAAEAPGAQFFSGFTGISQFAAARGSKDPINILATIGGGIVAIELGKILTDDTNSLTSHPRGSTIVSTPPMSDSEYGPTPLPIHSDHGPQISWTPPITGESYGTHVTDIPQPRGPEIVGTPWPDLLSPTIMMQEGADAAKGIPDVLAGADRAIIDPRKLTEYALNPVHPVGGNKARVFESAFGFNASNADDLLGQIARGVRENPAVAGKVDKYGSRFTVDIPVVGPKGSGAVRTGWIYKNGSSVPELTTLFPK